MLINYAGRIHGEKPFATFAETGAISQIAFYLVEFVKQIAIFASIVNYSKMLVVVIAFVAANQNVVECFV